MNLQDIDTSLGETGVKLTIKDINGNDTDATITLLSFYSEKGRNALLERARNNDKDTNGILVDLTVDWDNIELNGKAIPFNKEECAKLYKKYTIISRQVDEFVINQNNFLKKN